MKQILGKFKIYLIDLWSVLKAAGAAFSDDNALKLSASLSYYTVFSLAPTLIVIISVCSVFYGEEAVQGKIYGQMKDLIGSGSAAQVQELIKNVHLSNQSVFATIVGLITLFLGATGVFLEIQSSINYMWSLRTKPKKGIIKFFIGQLISFSMVISLGFLLVVSLMVNTFVDVFLGSFDFLFEKLTLQFFYIANIALIFVIITLLFCGIFKVLPDGSLRMKDAVIGAGFTAILFMIGKFLIGFYLGRSNTLSVYGSASSLVLILLWVYYSSIILYFGAEFTKTYAMKFGNGITPKSYAIMVKHKFSTT